MRPKSTPLKDYRCVNPENVVGIGPVKLGSREKPLAAVDPGYLKEAAMLCETEYSDTVWVWEYYHTLNDEIVSRGFAFSPAYGERPTEAVILAPRDVPREKVKVR